MRLAVVVTVMVLTAGPEVWAQAPSDIVWPTYEQTDRPSDFSLTCRSLAAEIDHVSADVSLLRHAQSRVEDVLHSAFDMERYGGRNGPGGMRYAAGAVGGKESYAQARGQIVASLRVAEGRRDHLKSLEPGCKPEPQPASVP